MRYSSRRLSFFSASSLTCIFLFILLQYTSNRRTSIGDYRGRGLKSQICDCSATKETYPVRSSQPLPPPSRRRLPRIQHRFGWFGAAQAERRDAVKTAFTRCWTAYRKHAWMADELQPVSGGSKEHFGGWAATLVDSLDTLWIMNLQDEFREAVEATTTINFRKTASGSISVFETTIRYLGGLLAAYDLSGNENMLEKAVELGDTLYRAFDTPNRMPVGHFNIDAAAGGRRQTADVTAILADIGSLTLEFTRLSQLTGECKYYNAVTRIMNEFDKQQNLSSIPGMWPYTVNAMYLDFHSGVDFPIGAMADSMYEYLPKMHALLGGSEMYEKMYKLAAEAIIQHNVFRPMVPDGSNVLMAGKARTAFDGHYAQPELRPDVEHLGCFAGGMFALGGRLFNNRTHIEIGQALAVGCYWAYATTPLGVMPEDFTVVPCSNWTTCEWNDTLHHEAVKAHDVDDPFHVGSINTVSRVGRLPAGFTSITNRHYILRPEAIESIFILYRITGDESLREMAWKMFENIQRATRTDLANSAVSDVTDEDAPKMNEMESFWLAETLKYFYLIFSDPTFISLDEYVFNTEAHPLRRPRGSIWRIGS